MVGIESLGPCDRGSNFVLLLAWPVQVEQPILLIYDKLVTHDYPQTVIQYDKPDTGFCLFICIAAIDAEFYLTLQAGSSSSSRLVWRLPGWGHWPLDRLWDEGEVANAGCDENLRALLQGQRRGCCAGLSRRSSSSSWDAGAESPTVAKPTARTVVYVCYCTVLAVAMMQLIG